eukprot:TRINITY_DN3335_c0_g2_i1.p1 TRINITY_DN3335_c0_g2~~TRINITY_DN3335_c0_g2_i1.p1  ORF type:complete len:750 (+),score=223.17 TRINITY_DN3335_c0_g2_i1:132-2381(+)
MRVRHLQSHLADQHLVHQNRLDQLQGARVGVDAVFWLRSIQALKDPFADALGGIPPGIFGFVDKELEMFKKHQIQPLFIFQGVAPGPQHSMFVSRMDQQMELAWTYLAKGQKSEAQKCFAVSTSRINGDFVYFIFHHLRHKGYECLQAPYFAGAQLAHFAEQGVVQTVFGPPGLLLYGVQSVVIHIDFSKQSFDWVDLESVLQKWQISRDQFVDACMLAGTEYCLTYPYLNLGHFQPAAPGRFNFDAAVFIIKKAPLINWMQTFPTEEMKNDHVDGYCTCKVLVQNSPVLHLSKHQIRSLGAGNAPQVPYDFHLIMGEKLPSAVYYLMLSGIISHKLPQALAKGEWTDKSQPLVDTKEFRTTLQELEQYRQTALGLLARHMAQNFHNKRILCKAFHDPHSVRQSSATQESKLPPNARFLTPSCEPGLKWVITADKLEAEMTRQGAKHVDFLFCLRWGNNIWEQSLAPLCDSRGKPQCSQDLKCLSALVHFMVLEKLELFAEDGGMTVFGIVLSKMDRHLQEAGLVAIEMLKIGVLGSEPLEPADPNRPFPEQVNYPQAGPGPLADRTQKLLLLTRVMSLVPMRLKNDMWNADVEFDLAAFHALVRILKRTLRQLVEASLASVLLTNLSLVKLLPSGFMCASPKKDNHLESPAVLPTFMLPRACMGIVVRHFLEYKGNPEDFPKDTQSKFPCCMQPLEDLKTAFKFWDEMTRCLREICEDWQNEDVAPIYHEMKEATEKILTPQRQRLGL